MGNRAKGLAYNAGKDRLTTGQVAWLCGVSSRTVQKWCDSGGLKNYRVPQSLDRRIFRADLREFLNAHGYPIPAALALAVCRLAIHLTDDVLLGSDWRTVDEFDLGAALATTRVNDLLIGDSCGMQAAIALAQRARAVPKADIGRLTVVLSDDASEPRGAGFVSRFVRRPFTLVASCEES